MIEFTNEDCMSLMARYPDGYFDLAIVDPPYQSNDAIGIKNGKKHNAKRKNYKLFENVAPGPEYFKELIRVSKHQIIWGGNFFGLKGGVIAWNKNGTAFGEGEIAICTTHASVRFFEYTWNGMIQGDMKNKQERIHPTEKPIQLYKYCLDRFAKPGDKILDTHGGSLSIGLACHDYGFDLVACELDPEIYNAALKRLKEHQSKPVLFDSNGEISVQQQSLFD
jgi:site-specific DNA-methyltransferase (adenine-specific)